jgi:hypothetical protein
MLHEEDNNNILGTVNLSYIYILYVDFTYCNRDSHTVMAVNVWWLDLHLPMQSVPIAIDVVGSTPGEVHTIMW